MKNIIEDLKRKDHKRYLGGLDFFRYIGPGLLVTVGFIDPGNWASNFAAGSEFGYGLLWVVTLSTVMLIILQHNVAHLGIVTGLCLSEAATKYAPRWVSRPVLATAVLASISTSLAEILGGAIALQMLLDVPIVWGAVLTTAFVVVMLFTNSYKKIERAIIAFVSVIGLSFLYELFLVDIDWPLAARGWVTPSLPEGSMMVVMSVLGAVVMPHNLFLHSEVIQSHEYNKRGDVSIRSKLKYELFDTLFSMLVGWAINSAMILLAASAFFSQGVQVDELQQAQSLLQPLLGGNAGIIFALALLMAGVSSTITSGMAGRAPFAGRGVGADMLHWRPVQGAACLADGAQHPAALHGIPAGRPHLVAPGDGPVCQQPPQRVHALRHSCGGDGAQPAASGRGPGGVKTAMYCRQNCDVSPLKTRRIAVENGTGRS